MKKKGAFYLSFLLFSVLFQYAFLISDDYHPNVQLSFNLSAQQSQKSNFRSGIYVHKAPQNTYYRQRDLSTLSATQLKKYFEQYNIAEKDIFSNTSLFMFDEFVRYAKTLPSYEKTICKLHKKLRKQGKLKKLICVINGNYTQGLQERVAKLHDEIHHKTNNERIKSQLLPSLSINQNIFDFAKLYNITEQQLTHKFTNQLKHNRHNKFIDYLSQASELETIYKQAPDFYLFLNAVGYGVANGIEANIYHQEEIAITWSTFCHEALEIAKGIAEGIKEGIVNTGMFFVNLYQDPQGSVQNFIHGIGNLLLLSAKVANIQLKLNFYKSTGDYLGLFRYMQKLKKQCAFMIDTCAIKLKAMPNRDIARNTSAFIVEWYLIGKTFDLGFKLCSQIKSLLNSFVESLIAEPVVEYALATTEGGIMHFRQKTSEIGSATKKIVKACEPALEVFREQFMEKLAPQIAKARNMFDQKIKGFGALKDKYFKFNLEHIFGMHFKSNKRGLSNISGFHLDNLQVIEKRGIIEFANKKMLNNGVYKADLLFNGKIVKESGTFFPSNWTIKETIGKFKEVCNYCIKHNIEPILQNNGKYRIRGITKDGIKMEIWSTQKGIITTMYPLFEEGIKWK